MALNPIVYTEKVVRSFLKYQLSAYPFADPELHDQMRQQLSLDEVRRSPLLRGPYISLSRGFRQGAAVQQLIADGVLHAHMAQLIPPEIAHVYGHQEKAMRAIAAGKTTLVSTGTGSGKTECFLYPIISHCLSLRDQGAPPGIAAVIVYPMNALAEDQLDRLRGILAGSGITFGMYVGKTPQYEREVAGYRMPEGSSNADYQATLERYREQGRSDSIHPREEACSREVMRTDGRQPRILLTNVKQLELLLTRQTDVELFHNARLQYLAFDEAHTFTGASGAETACLIRRLRTFCGSDAEQTTSIATSATIVDEQDPDAARKFASRFFGVPAESVETINEEYQREEWKPQRTVPPPLAVPGLQLLNDALAAVESESPEQPVGQVCGQLTGESLPVGDWRAALYEQLRGNEIAAQICVLLDRPRNVQSLVEALGKNVGRVVSEEELLVYLTLGAASLHEGRPLLRPVVHGFVRGISGGVVTFENGDRPQLWLSAEDELADDGQQRIWRPAVHTCTTCGQHYFVSALKDFSYVKTRPEGGQCGESGSSFWEAMDETTGGQRVILVDHILNMDEEETARHDRTTQLFFCRSCGAAHPEQFGRCLGCGDVQDPVRLFAVRTGEKHPGFLNRCLSCTANGRPLGRRYREPMRPVRATTVSDVHVLAQDMVHNADRKRLLLFADNRQDAAFQAGWMKDHARRFRLRRLMADAISGGQVGIEDVAQSMNTVLEEDEPLSRALAPEVWRAVPKEGSEARHAEERLYFLRIQVLREVTMGANQRLGLEPWGRIKISYAGLDSSTRFIQQWANQIGISPDDLKSGIEAILDRLRRQRLLKDPLRGIFTRYWNDGDQEIQRGYLPSMLPPRGMKLRRAADDREERVFQWLGDRMTLLRSIVVKWGLEAGEAQHFLEELWKYLTDDSYRIIVPVTLKGSKGRPLPNCSGVYQIDAAKLRISENHGYYRCVRCGGKVVRRTPRDRCLAWQCNGRLEFVKEDRESYDLQLLDERYVMLKPEEHTAMVPQDHRERIENWFKGSSDAVNALVCTPTLELGVDIGALDSVLLRNVPPLPANYWQRVGRAGRRHRMAVNVAYCRPTSHDRAYFNEPLKMLAGRVDPPAFNLRNELMVAKHVHAATITRLNQLAAPSSDLPEAERDHIRSVLENVFPARITSYLFEPGGTLRAELFDAVPFRGLVNRYRDDLLDHLQRVFRQGWPGEDEEVTSSTAIAAHLDASADHLLAVIKRLRKRLQWAHREVRRLNQIREAEGTLDQQDEAHFRRCDRLIKKLKGIRSRKRQEAEGIDDINTYSVLAMEGYLPGYGLDTGTVVGLAEVPYWQLGSMDFTLPRPTSMALREYVPGNLIYANGHRFVARQFHRLVEVDGTDSPIFSVNLDRQAIIESGAAAASLGANDVKAIPVCDVDLVHTSQISDEEENRFQMSVAVYGLAQDRHNGGTAYDAGTNRLLHRRGMHFRMVNVGASSLLDRQPPELGYPVCEVCGQSVSPLASMRQLDHFRESHLERCGRTPLNVGFYADVVADSITIPEIPNATVAYSVLESLRMAAASLLDMHLEDLQLLVIGHVDRDEVDAVLWDPMPGGSGLLDQMLERFNEVIATGFELAADCPSACERSCTDCLQTFRNGFYHKYLDRHEAVELLEAWTGSIQEAHPIPAPQPLSANQPRENQPVNDAETKLKHLLTAAGFTSGAFQEQIRFRHTIEINRTIGSTTPDVYYLGDEDDPDDRGACIYLDGLSRHIHGNPETQERDREIRSWLRAEGYVVIAISRVELDDHGAMVRHFRKLARHLEGRDLAQQIAEDATWFAQPTEAADDQTENFPFEPVEPTPEDCYRTCVPLIPLKAAAGGFGDPATDLTADAQWVKLRTSRSLQEGMFVAQVVGKSMEPEIPNGAYCLFRGPVAGSREGKVLLVRLRDDVDPDTGERFTVKRYSSEKREAEDGGWRHVRIELRPVNADYSPIVLEDDSNEQIDVLAELFEVLTNG